MTWMTLEMTGNKSITDIKAQVGVIDLIELDFKGASTSMSNIPALLRVIKRTNLTRDADLSLYY